MSPKIEGLYGLGRQAKNLFGFVWNMGLYGLYGFVWNKGLYGLYAPNWTIFH